MPCLRLPRCFVKLRFWVSLTSLATAAIILYVYSLERRESREPLDHSQQKFVWQHILNLTSLPLCRNSAQGMQWITDELGFVCPLSSVLSSGCCEEGGEEVSRFNCSTCGDDGCCKVFENCVSCCLHPDKKPLLMSIIGRETESYNPLYASLTDQFELCLTKCRTSSKSVMHENMYRNPSAKHCYGAEPTQQLQL